MDRLERALEPVVAALLVSSPFWAFDAMAAWAAIFKRVW